MKLTSTFVLAAVLALKTSGILALPFATTEIASLDARDAGVLSEIEFEAREFNDEFEVEARGFDDEFEFEARDFEYFEELEARTGGASAVTTHATTTHPTTHVASAGKPVNPANAFFSNEIKAQEAQLHHDQTALLGLEHPHTSTGAHGASTRPTLNRATSLHGLHPATGASHLGHLGTGRLGSHPLSTQGRRPLGGLRSESRLSAQGARRRPSEGLGAESRLHTLRPLHPLRTESGRRPLGGLRAQGTRRIPGEGLGAESRLRTLHAESRLANSRAGARPGSHLETAAQRGAAVRLGQENRIESSEKKLEHEIRLEKKLESLQG